MSSCVSQYTHICAVNLPLDIIPIKKITLITVLPNITWRLIWDSKLRRIPVKLKLLQLTGKSEFSQTYSYCLFVMVFIPLLVRGKIYGKLV